MKRQKLLMICCGMLILILASCEGTKNPISMDVLDETRMQAAPTQPSDDTLGSDIAVVIVAVGDSITFGDGSWRGGYPVFLEEKLRAAGYNVIVRNAGIPGARAWEIEAYFLDAIDRAEIALIMAGTNDLPSLGTPADGEPLDHIESMIDKAQRANTIPIVSTVPPQFDCPVDYDDRIKNLNAQIYALAAWQDVQLVDTYQAVLNHGGISLYFDCVHFNDQGYEVIAEQFYQTIITNPLIRNH